MYSKIMSLVNYGGLKLRNRIIFAPISMWISSAYYVNKLLEIAVGSVAMIIIGDVSVRKQLIGPSLYNRYGFLKYKNLINAIHQEGCKVCVQLHQSDSNILGMIKYVPNILSKKYSDDQIRVLLNNEIGPYIRKFPLLK